MRARPGILLLLPLLFGLATAVVGWFSIEFATNAAARSYASRRLSAARQVLTDAQRDLDGAAGAYADLDGMFDFATSRNPDFARQQFTEQRLRNLDIDQIIVTDLRGNVLASRSVIGPGDPGGTRQYIPTPASALTGVTERGNASGWSLSDQPVLIAARAIRPSGGGQASRGMVVVARAMDRSRLDAINRSFDGRLVFLPKGDGGITDGTVRVDGWREVTAYAALPDETGQGGVLVRAEPRLDEARAGANIARNAMLATAIIGSMTATVVVTGVVRRAQSRVDQMRADVLAMTADTEAPLDRLVDYGDDSIGTLGAAVADSLRRMQDEARDQVQAAREATAGERLGEAIVRGMDEGVVLMRADGVCQVCNSAAASAFGIDARSVIGDRFAMQRVLGAELLGQLTVLAAGEAPRPVPIDLEVNGRSLQLTAENFARSDRETPGLLVRVRDVTAIVEAEGLRRDLVSIVSHDLRTPLTVIASTIELMRDSRTPVAPPEDGRMLEMMDRNVERMQELIGDLLDSASLDAGQMQFDFDTIDLGALAREMAELHRTQAEARHMPLYVDVPIDTLLVRADRRRLRQVLANLLGNAVKYADDGAQVWLRVLSGEGAARIEVINTGHPIAPADQVRIFEKFYRGEHSRRTSRGTGLGLAISKQIAEAHGGSLWLERSDAASNVFCMTLPLIA